VSVLLIEQKLTIAMKISDRALVMGHGASCSTARPTACAPTPGAQGVAGGLSRWRASHQRQPRRPTGAKLTKLDG
jgi:ABC-type glutathione transport system ATPase component